MNFVLTVLTTDKRKSEVTSALQSIGITVTPYPGTVLLSLLRAYTILITFIVHSDVTSCHQLFPTLRNYSINTIPVHPFVNPLLALPCTTERTRNVSTKIPGAALAAARLILTTQAVMKTRKGNRPTPPSSPRCAALGRVEAVGVGCVFCASLCYLFVSLPL
jgi:hypothetical protein